MPVDLRPFLPGDRYAALARGAELPDRLAGTALFADISGFTPLAEALARAFGPRRGAEELVSRLNGVYQPLVAVVARFGGSTIGYSGDAFTCWFDEPDPPGATPSLQRALECAGALQGAMAAIATVSTPASGSFTLGLSIGVAGGSVRRFVVGDPQIQQLDVLAGRLLDRLFAAEQSAGQGEVVLPKADASLLAAMPWAAHSAPAGDDFVRITPAPTAALPTPAPPPAAAPPLLPAASLRPWVLPAVYRRLEADADPLLSELRPATALMLRFSGVDYDHADNAGALLDAYIRWSQQVLARYEGCLLDLTMGYASSYLYAVFGAPVAHADDAARAVSAALELVAPPAALGIGETRVGIAQGQMLAGLIGGDERRAYGVLGDPANLAFRLMNLCPPGAIRCDALVARQSRRRWAFRELPPVTVKGKASPARIYEPTDAPAAAEEAGHGRRAFVGREPELLKIEAALADLAAGRPRTLVLEGEAGIGKSRLVEQALALAHQRGLGSLRGAGQSLEQQSPYRAWREILGAYLTDVVPGWPALPSASLAARLRERYPELSERLPLLNAVLDLGLPETGLTRSLDARLRSESLEGLVIELLQARASAQPLLLVLEDAHWLDSRSSELMARLARASAATTTALLLLVTTRPLDDESPALAASTALLQLPGSERLQLGMLPPDALLALVARRLGVGPEQLPDALRPLVLERAAGNPLFAEELIAELLARDVIAVTAGPDGSPHCEAGGGLDQASALLPDTLQGLLLSRLDRLPQDEQLTVKVAAVIGPTFAYAPLHYAYGQHRTVSPVGLRGQLRRLAAQEITWLELPEPELTYSFRHLLVRDAAYETLLYTQRRSLHRAVAAWYEGAAASPPQGPAQAPPSAYPLLAYHYQQAEDLERERHYARLAGEAAAERFANLEALAHLSRALELAPEHDRALRYELLLTREHVYSLLGRRDEQRRDLEALAEHATALGDLRRQAEVTLRQGRYAEFRSDFEAACGHARHAAALARAAADHEREGGAYLNLGRALIRQSSYADADEALGQALTLAQSTNLPALEAEVLLNRSLIALDQGHLAAAEAGFRQALERFQRVGDRRGELRSLGNLASIEMRQGSRDKALALFGEVLSAAQALGDRRTEAVTLGNSGIVLKNEFRLSAAQRHNARALQISRELGDRYIERAVLHNNAETWALIGDYATAVAHKQQALAIARAIGDQRGQCLALEDTADLLCEQGALAAAHTAALEALAIARALGAASIEASTTSTLARVLELQGSPEAAATYQSARSQYEALGQGQRALEAIAGLARLALAAGDLPTALQYGEQILALEGQITSTVAEPLRIYLTCYRALSAAQDPRAGPLLRTAHELLQQRAARIDDPAFRQSHLERIAHHRELIDAWAQAGHDEQPRPLGGPGP